MRLAIFWSAQVYCDDEGYVTNGFAHRWFTPLARHFSGADVIVRGANRATGTSRIDTDGLNIQCLPAVHSAARLYTYFFPVMVFSMFRMIWVGRRTWDRVLVYEAAPLAQVWFWMCKAAGLPVVLYLGGHHEEAVVLRSQGESRLRRFFAATWSRWCRFSIPLMVRHAPTIVTGSELAEHYKTSNRRGIFTIVSSSVTQDSIAEDIASRRRTDSRSVPVVLTVCSLSPVKGVDYLIKASAQLARQGDQHRLQIVGPSRNDYRSHLEALVQQLGVEDIVEFTGPIFSDVDLKSAYDAADIFVLPSLSEGTPKVILEAMSRGLPVISTDVGSVTDLVTDEHTGLLVPSQSVEELAAALRRLICDTNLRDRIAQAGLTSIHSMTVETQTERLAHLISGTSPATGTSYERSSEPYVAGE